MSSAEADIYTEDLLSAPVPANVDVTLREEKSGKVVFEKKGLKSAEHAHFLKRK